MYDHFLLRVIFAFTFLCNTNCYPHYHKSLASFNSSLLKSTLITSETRLRSSAYISTINNNSINICKVCWCNKKDRKDILTCRKDNILTQFPVIPDPIHRSRIREINIENQQGLTKLRKKDLLLYPDLTHLTITNSGLSTLEEDTFVENTKLEEIDLRDNQIQILKWELFQKLPLSILTITGNPLACNCSNKWIQKIMEDSSQNLGPYWDRIRCSTKGGLDKILTQVNIPGCDIPTATIYPKKIIINATESALLTCNVSGDPHPRVSWIIEDSFNRISEPLKNPKNFENSVFENSSVIYDSLTNAVSIALQNSNRSNTLLIDNITGPDVGTVRCVAENIVGMVKDEATIEIRGKPRIEKLEFENKFHFCLSYRVTGVPNITKIWHFNDKPLENHNKITDLEDPRMARNSYLKEGCLQFERPVQKILGNYTLVAINSYGIERRTVTIDHQTAGLPSLPPRGIKPPQVDVSILNHGERISASSDEITQTGSISFRVIIISIGLLGTILLFIFALILTVMHKQNTRNKKMENGLTVVEKIPLNGSKIVGNPNYLPHCEQILSDSGLPIIEANRITLIKELGEGNFGNVYLGTVQFLKDDENETLVAIKTLKNCSEYSVRQDFEREAEVLSNLEHKNIVQLFGISIDGDNLMMIIEYMKFGDLNNFLRTKDPHLEYIRIAHSDNDNGDDNKSEDKLCFSDLMKIALQIASGLDYLSSQHFVHRDLATRNCLVGDDLLIKIGDFGMSRDLYETDYYKIGRNTILPIRWMAPESILYHKFTLQSDVWSFGVTLWELFSYAKQPYYELSNEQVSKEIPRGKVLSRPEACPDKMYQLMLICWTNNPHQRPSAHRIVNMLKEYAHNECTNDIS